MGQYLNVQKNLHLSGTWCLVSFQKNINTFNIFHIRYKKKNSIRKWIKSETAVNDANDR